MCSRDFNRRDIYISLLSDEDNDRKRKRQAEFLVHKFFPWQLVTEKGIALQFKQAFPENFRQYAQACRSSKVQPGQMFVVSTGNLFNPHYIINFPTKRHWKGNSRIEDIEIGLKALIAEIKRLNIKSIAIK